MSLNNGVYFKSLAGEPGDELGDLGRGGSEGAAAAGGPQQRAAQPTAPDRFRRKPGTRFDPRIVAKLICFLILNTKHVKTRLHFPSSVILVRCPYPGRNNQGRIAPPDKRFQPRIDDDCQNPASPERRNAAPASAVSAARSVLRQREGRPYILIKVRPKWMREEERARKRGLPSQRFLICTSFPHPTNATPAISLSNSASNSWIDFAHDGGGSKKRDFFCNTPRLPPSLAAHDGFHLPQKPP